MALPYATHREAPRAPRRWTGADEDHKLWKKILCGMSSGVLAQAVASPMDVVKVRMQADVMNTIRGEPAQYSSLRHCCVQTVQKNGLPGMFKGIVPSCQRAAAVQGSSIPAYDHFKHLLVDKTGWGATSMRTLVTASWLSSTVAAMVSTPFDVAKTRLIRQDNTDIKYRGMIDCLLKVPFSASLLLHVSLPSAAVLIHHPPKVFKTEGVVSLYKGLVPTIA
eukprot:gene1350-2742_t